MENLSYNLSKIASIVKGNLISNNNSDHKISAILIDTRKPSYINEAIFFCLVTKRNDGHKFIEQAYKIGIKSFVVSQLPANYKKMQNVGFVLVTNTLLALQQLASYHRSLFNIPVIGITGSNGKTIVKEWLYQLLSIDKKIVRSPKSYNSQIGVPLSVWQMGNSHQIAIFEAGISEPNEMDKLQAIIQPNIGIFTNIGLAHDENFIHINQKIGEKLKLFTKVDTLIYCSDYYEITERIIKTELSKNFKLFTWSKKTNADLIINSVEKLNRSTKIIAKYKSNSIEILIPFTDDGSIENAINCLATLLLLGYKNSEIRERFTYLQPIEMRLELKEGINNCSIINDSYSSDLHSLNIALDFTIQQKQHTKKTVILSDILQSGRIESELYKEVSLLLKEKSIDRIIGIGNQISKYANLFDLEKQFYPTTYDFIKNIGNLVFQNETILVKGARLFEFESINEALAQKTHETVLEINLSAIANNLKYYQSKLFPKTKIMVMVKAFSYGSGSFEIANVLQYNHVDYLAVAFVDEGIELRKAGITLPIVVMNPEVQNFDVMLNHQLEPEIYSLRLLKKLKGDVLNKPEFRDTKIPIHIKLDTGMHRLGFDENNLNELASELKSTDSFIVKSIFSHLSASEDPSQDNFTQTQFDKFRRMSQILVEELNYNIDRHILNSAGISRFKNEQFEMVRLGIGLYGVTSVSHEQSYLQEVATLKTIISQIKEIKANESIGYGRNTIVKEPTRIATIPIGYADGIRRCLGNGNGKFMIKGQLAPIIGNVCMDMCMLDISKIYASEGDEVIIFGKDLPIEKIASDMHTIPYEVITSISRRVKRIYFNEE